MTPIRGLWYIGIFIGLWRTANALLCLPFREVVGEPAVCYDRIIALKSCSTAFNKMCFHKNTLPQKSFLHNLGEER